MSVTIAIAVMVDMVLGGELFEKVGQVALQSRVIVFVDEDGRGGVGHKEMARTAPHARLGDESLEEVRNILKLHPQESFNLDRVRVRSRVLCCASSVGVGGHGFFSSRGQFPGSGSPWQAPFASAQRLIIADPGQIPGRCTPKGRAQANLIHKDLMIGRLGLDLREDAVEQFVAGAAEERDAAYFAFLQAFLGHQ